MIKYNEELGIFYSPNQNSDFCYSGHSSKRAGNGKSLSNVVSFFKRNDYNYRHIVRPVQIHSTNIVAITSAPKEEIVMIDDCDGVITNLPFVALTTVTADCVPLVFTDQKNKVIGVSHQGWRGSLKRMSQKMTEKMLDLGANISNLCVSIGPTIGECCYNIDEERYYSFMEEFEKYEKLIFHERHSSRHLSLSYLNFLLLTEAGVPTANINFFPFCTKCDSSRFYSFRREHANNPGEMFSFALLN